MLQAIARRPRADDGEEGLEDPIKENGAQPSATPAVNGEGGVTKSARRRQKKAAARQADGSGEAAEVTPATDAVERKVKTPREPRKPKGPPRGEPSKTLLFVANLPFAFSDEQLKGAFDGFKVKTATVVKRRFGTRTKGFGFVDLENEDEQQRALKEVHGKQVEGRDLQLKGKGSVIFYHHFLLLKQLCLSLICSLKLLSKATIARKRMQL